MSLHKVKIRGGKVVTPKDIYDGLFNGNLRPSMEYAHHHKDDETGELVGRIIEFMENILIRDTE